MRTRGSAILLLTAKRTPPQIFHVAGLLSIDHTEPFQKIDARFKRANITTPLPLSGHMMGKSDGAEHD